MEHETYEESNKRKRFTLLQKDDSFQRQQDLREQRDLRDREDRYSEDRYSDDILTITCKDETMNELPAKRATRGRPKKKTESLEWSDESTEALIELWEQRGELFNKSHLHFYARDMKDKAVDDIKQELHSRGFYVTTDQILSKFQSLRTYFCSQRTKLSQSKKSGQMPEDAECKWRFFRRLHFLDDNMKPREGFLNKRYYDGDSSLNSPAYFHSMVPKEELQEIYRNEGVSPKPELENFKLENAATFDQSKAPKSPQNSTKNEDQLFGELIGNMIHQLAQGQQKDLLKLEIQQLIIKAKYANSNATKNE